MTIEELLEFCDPLEVIGELPARVGKLCQDSRTVKSGDIFIAVKGSISDGHNFIRDAVANGASIVISEKAAPVDHNVAQIIVKNSRSLLGPLAQLLAGNPAHQMNVIGITGTNGKTTVATLVWQILTKTGHKASMLGTVEKRINNDSFESRLTTSDPIELAEDMQKMVDAGSQYLVMEVSSHALHQQRVNGIPFTVAAFTNLTHDHLDYHQSFDEYASAKKILFNSLDNKSWAITNVDDPKGEWITNSTPAKVLTFGFKGKGLISATIIQSGYEGMVLRIDDTEIFTPLAGDFNAYNVLQALLICTALGLDGSAIKDALKECKGAAGRLERITTKDSSKNLPTIFVDYAHTPDALENVATTLKKLKSNRDKLIILFGCGGDRDKTKRPEMARIAEQYGNEVIVTSDNPRTEDPDTIISDIMKGFKKPENVTAITSREEAIKKVIKESGPRAVILIAGKGHETYQEINRERVHFDDREIALAALMEKNGNPEKEEVA
ncbi:MAG: UDP-N-acetylmuramoyl-L-alanyl-D-glutamate--2,6-diaminopimelate ligase [Balneolaceae bacterium]